MARAPDQEGIVWTNLKFYHKTLNEHPSIQKRLDKLEKKRQTIVPFMNLADESTSEANPETLPFDIPYFMHGMEIELCKGNFNSKSVSFRIFICLVFLEGYFFLLWNKMNCNTSSNQICNEKLGICKEL